MIENVGDRQKRRQQTAFANTWTNIGWVLRTAWTTNWWLFLAFWLNAALISLLPAAVALASRELINAITAAMENTAGGSNEEIMLWLAVSFAATLAIALTQALNRLIIQSYREDLIYRLTDDIIHHISLLPYANFEDSEFLDIKQRASQNPANHVVNFLKLFQGIVTNVIQVISLAIILVVIEPMLVLLLLPVALPYLLFRWRLTKRRFDEEYVRTEKRRWMGYYVRQMSNERTASEVKILNLAPVFIARNRGYMAEFRQMNKSLYRLDFVGNVIFIILSLAAVYVAFARVITRVIDGGLTLGDVVVFGAAANKLRTSLEGIIAQSTAMRLEMLFVDNIRELFAYQPLPLPDGSRSLQSGQGEIEFRDVTFTYPKGDRPVLHDLSFHVKPGETIALVGENGAGKTTIAKLIARLYDVDQGEVLLNRCDVRTVASAELHQRIAFVFQQFARYSATAGENIAFGNWEELLEDKDRVEAVARRTGVHELIAAMPEGYETMLGRTFGRYTLSGGQWQRLAIARALARDADILLLDEPTANLDIQAEYELYQRFQELARGRTAILISHRFSTVRMADRILVLDQGRIIENGSHDALMRDGGKYASLYRLYRLQMDGSSENLHAPGTVRANE